MEEEDFLAAVEADNAGTPVEEPNPEPETVTEPVTPPEPEHPAPVEPAPVDTHVTVKMPDPGFVPIGAIMDERDKRKALEAEIEKLRAAQPVQQAQAPDMYEDPDGFAAYQAATTQNAVLNTKLDLSEEMARERHGDDVVEAAKQWALQRFAQNPAYQAEVLSQRNPYGHVVKEFQRHSALEKIGDPSRIDAFLAWEAAQQQITQQQAPPGAVPPSPPPSIPPRSLASAPSAGGVLEEPAITDQDVFEEAFPKRK